MVVDLGQSEVAELARPLEVARYDEADTRGPGASKVERRSLAGRSEPLVRGEPGSIGGERLQRSGAVLDGPDRCGRSDALDEGVHGRVARLGQPHQRGAGQP